jgi:hypothetical protein
MGPYVLVLMFVGIGGLFTLLGHSNLKSIRKNRATWLSIQGAVVDLVERTGSKGKTLYAPVYRYTVSGAEYTATSNTASTPPGYKVGDPIKLVVNPEKPGDSEVIDSSTWIFSCGLLTMGVLVLAIGILLAWLVATGKLK